MLLRSSRCSGRGCPADAAPNSKPNTRWDGLAPRPGISDAQNPVLKPLKTDAKLVDSISQEVGLGPAQFVPHLAQPLQPDKALVLCFSGQFGKPLQEKGMIRLPPGKGRLAFVALDLSLFANLRKCKLRLWQLAATHGL